MKVYDAIIVGSGAAGAWAAKQLKTKNILMLDVGNRPKVTYSSEIPDYYSLKKNPTEGEPILIGEQFESLSNIFTEYLSPKLKSPHMKYVVQTPPGSKTEEIGFNSQQSFALGGLGNAWGAGCYRFQDFEMTSFPFPAADLQPYYDALTENIGISGCADDLTPFYGTTDRLLSPIQKTRPLETIYSRYLKKKSQFNSKGYYFGHPRLAYKNYESKGLDYYLSHNPSIYTPAFTVQELISQNKMEYVSGMLVSSFKESADGVEVYAKDLSQNQNKIFTGKTLILAMGALNSAKCVLTSYNDCQARLPLLDNNMSFIPFLFPQMLGSNWSQENVIGSPMTLIKTREGKMPLQISLYNIGSVLISDLLPSLPLSADVLAKVGQLLLPALMVTQVFYPDSQNSENYLSLNSNGQLKLNYKKTAAGSDEGDVIRQMRKIGLLSATPLIQYPSPGNSFHYAGMLPMRANPDSKYECHPDGRLSGTKRVFVADAAGFPELPAKNHTFTIMANAMRIADNIQKHYLEKLL